MTSFDHCLDYAFLQVNFSSTLDPASGSTSSGGARGSHPKHLPRVAFSPIIHPRIQEFRSGSAASATLRGVLPASPTASLHDRYNSPAAGSAKRRLFGDKTPTTTPTAVASPCVNHVPSPAKRLTFGGGSGGTLRIGASQTQTAMLSVPLQGETNQNTNI